MECCVVSDWTDREYCPSGQWSVVLFQTGLTGSIVQVVSGVFCAAHPEVDLAKQLLARLSPGWITTIVPFDGFLRCEQNRNLYNALLSSYPSLS